MIKHIRSKFIKSVKSGKFNVFLLFFGLSFMFLLLTKLTKDYTKTISFDIEPVHARENHVILKDSMDKLDVTLTTYGFKFMRYYLSNPKLQVDLGNLDIVDNKYIWTKNKGISFLNKQFSENVNIVAVNPDTLTFYYDVNAIKKIPVKFNSEIAFVPGYDISENYELNPDTIKIIGPKVLIDTIHQVKTQLLKLEGVNSDIDSELNLILPDSSKSITYSHHKINIKGKVEKFTEGELEIPINVINIPDSITVNYFPKSVNVKFYTSLSNFKTISKNDFIVECNFKELDSTDMYLEPKVVKYPENVKNVKVVQKQIDFIISK